MSYIGVDEAGTGSAIGDIYACAMVLDPELESDKLITDSKKLTPARRLVAFESIQTSKSQYGIGIVSHIELDAIGMARARRLVFERAIQALEKNLTLPVKRIIFDGIFGVDILPNVTMECVPKADANFPAVSAASIVAKVSRDQSILALCNTHPDLDTRYGWASNKGYLSAFHSNAIATNGLSEFHRKSFRYKALNPQDS